MHTNTQEACSFLMTLPFLFRCLTRIKIIATLERGKYVHTCKSEEACGCQSWEFQPFSFRSLNENGSPPFPFAYTIKITQSVSTVIPNLCRREEQDRPEHFIRMCTV